MADYFGTDTVVSELRGDDGLLIIRINRPEVANALNGVTSAAMENIMNHAETEAVRAIVVTGTGKVFCAGEDLPISPRAGECQMVTGARLRPHCALFCAPSRSSAPATARRGGGVEIALSCDMVAADMREFGCTEVDSASSPHRRHRAPRATSTARTAWSFCSPQEDQGP